MKRLIQVSLFMILVCGMGALAKPLSLCDFQSMETHFRDMRLSFNYRYFNDASTEGIDVRSGRIAVAYNELSDTLSEGFTLAGNIEISLSDFTPVSGLGQGAGTLRHYLSEEQPLFGFGGLEASFTTSLPQPHIELRAGVGYGRFSDVTPLAKALRIEHKLLKLEAIPDTLPDAVIMALAEQISRRAEFTNLKELMGAIQTLIEQASGTSIDPLSLVMVGVDLKTLNELLLNMEGLIEEASGTTLNAQALLVIQDEMLRTGDEKNCGWAVQGGIGYELSDPYGGTRDLLLTASADAAFAPDPDSQILLHASFSGPLAAIQENTLGLTSSYVYALTDQLAFHADYALECMTKDEGSMNVSHSASFELALGFGGANVALQLALTKEPDVPGWSSDFTISMAMDLL
ncbi:hypothetical protein J7K60_02505 [Candidatus Bipolaricaulota bacterium]|nr:hypothetical protein [Candidatus Bipolaricaulota bacterium]